ncbi:MAG: MFS transporter [Proteobacteria bacterium]|nr:MFS transporter [Pseudomonadota bacterium]
MKKSLLILFFCLFVVMIGYGLILPVLPLYIERLALTGGAPPSQASFQVGILTGVFALMQFFFAPLWGKWSDQLGRRPLFLTGLGGYAISMFLFSVGTNLVMLYSARILGGALSAALLPMANAYVADMTSEKDRGRGMAWLGSTISLGIVVGPALGAFLSQFDLHLTYKFGHISVDGFSIPFFGAGLLSVLALIVAKLWLRESLKPQELKLLDHQQGLEYGLNLRSTRWFIPRWLRLFLALAFLNQFALATFEGTFALHAKELLQFGPSEMGWVFAMCGIIMAAAPAVVVSWLIGRLGEKLLLPTGFALTGVALAMLMTAQRMDFILSNVALFALGVALIGPSLATLVSKRAGGRPGAALGQLNGASSLGLASGPALAGFLLAWKVHAPYLLTALMLVATSVYLTMTMLHRSE